MPVSDPIDRIAVNIGQLPHSTPNALGQIDEVEPDQVLQPIHRLAQRNAVGKLQMRQFVGNDRADDNLVVGIAQRFTLCR